MAKAKSKAATSAAVTNTPVKKRRYMPLGPISPSSTEITVIAGLVDGDIAATPSDFTYKSKPTAHLICDHSDLSQKIPNADLRQVADCSELHGCMMDIMANRLTTGANDNQATIAGSIELVEAGLKDACKVVLFTSGAEVQVPEGFDGWKVSKLDTRSNPHSFTLTRV